MDKCIVCGCTQERACPEGCSWSLYDPPVCSSCVAEFAIARLWEIVWTFDFGANRTAAVELKNLRRIWQTLHLDSPINTNSDDERRLVPPLARIRQINRRYVRATSPQDRKKAAHG